MNKHANCVGGSTAHVLEIYLPNLGGHPVKTVQYSTVKYSMPQTIQSMQLVHGQYSKATGCCRHTAASSAGTGSVISSYWCSCCSLGCTTRLLLQSPRGSSSPKGSPRSGKDSEMSTAVRVSDGESRGGDRGSVCRWAAT